MAIDIDFLSKVNLYSVSSKRLASKSPRILGARKNVLFPESILKHKGIGPK